MNNDKLTTIIGGILAAITVIQPMLSAIDGQFKLTDGIQILAAALIAGLGFYINKIDKPNT